MSQDRSVRTVRRQLRLGRTLPLGGPEDGAWILECAAAGALRRAVAGALPGVRLETLRLDLAEAGAASRPAVPPPPGALPPGPLRITADFAATADAPLPAVAARLRAALWSASEELLGLALDSVDLRVTALLDQPAEPDEPPGPPGPWEAESPADALARAVRAVPGVARLAPALAGAERAVRVEDRTGEGPGSHTVRHVSAQFAVAAGHRALEVARAVRAATAAASPAPVTVAAVVTAVDAK
ncbi:nucleopolyhedrovirus P10 family protein [Streptomyces gamaensis]|uniref:Nucleopolyhedrovirus P10 family protein n=1 Tax=Streptomyces gamaensis TaxID=1763542 RepID=A0ABW0Z3T2_9ACTN